MDFTVDLVPSFELDMSCLKSDCQPLYNRVTDIGINVLKLKGKMPTVSIDFDSIDVDEMTRLTCALFRLSWQ